MSDPKPYLHATRPPQGIFAKAFAFLLTLVLVVVGLMFSAIALIVAAIAGLAFWGWLRWKTRHLRQAMADRPAPGFGTTDGVIEGVAVRVDEAESPPGRA